MKTVLLLFLMLLTACTSTQEPEFDLIISNVSIIDGTGAEIKNGQNIYIKGNTIHSINSNKINQTQKVIDGTGKYVIPGLFDCHVHTSDFENDFPRFMHYGVTSVFITGGSLCTNQYYAAMRDQGNQDSIPSPRVFHTSQHFSMEGRHPSKTYSSSNWRDGESIFYLRDTLQIETLIKQVSKYPIVGIKLTIEDGPAPPFVERMPQEFINKTVKEASKYKLEVFAHVSDNTELEMAIQGGVQNLVHFTGVNIDPNNNAHLNLIQQIKNRNGSWVTTLMIDKSFLYPVHPEWLEAKEMLPIYKEMKNELTEERVERASFYIEILKEEYNLEEGTLSAFMKPQVEDIQFLNEMGVNMVLGSDTGNDFNFCGYSIHEEMQLLELGGMKPLDIIKMGTHNAAKMLNVIDTQGTIEKGKFADMILLDKNPLNTIKNTLSINTVVKNGKIQKRITY
ncbi:amidohydrolase family protein [Aureisphaera sp. CAU 1614]|uniref:Amidohydrolase family protein n=1 Tax=Halomarinibacterium sedimenti TaxID=2857106 RepID=A0A9X1FMD2_9FLAO|nr:amidohydrolase family protein [Halomarinibacterium sedimenti]MBW2937131.1 amidohydrolase family protein [Halomarinibacterium sedimenti]